MALRGEAQSSERWARPYKSSDSFSTYLTSSPSLPTPSFCHSHAGCPSIKVSALMVPWLRMHFPQMYSGLTLSSSTCLLKYHLLSEPWASLVAQMVRNLPAMQETRVWSQGQATHSSTLAWRIPWTEEPGGLQFMELQRVRHDWVSNTATTVSLVQTALLKF